MTMRPRLPVIPPTVIISPLAQNTDNRAEEDAAAKAAAAHAHHGHHRGHRIGPGRSGPANIMRPRPPPARALQPRRGAAAAGAPGISEDHDDEMYESHDLDEQRRFMDASNKTINQGDKDDSSHDSNSREGKHKERHFAAIIKAPGTKRLSLPPLSSSPVPAKLEAVAASLLTLAAKSRPAALGAGVQSKALGIARQWMATAGTGDANVTLAAVRSTLMNAGVESVPEAALGESARLWMPAYLLNLHKPRTPRQQQQAADTLAMLERASMRLEGGGDGS